MNVLDHSYEVSTGEVRNVKVSLDPILDAGETASSGTVAEQFSSDLTLGSVAAGAAADTIRGRSVATGRWVQFSVQGSVAGRHYEILLSVTTSDSQTLKMVVAFDGV